ncbi:MAG: hypothetical protein COA42_00595 [Alteromonadaceae bacterium]|nr:MAG: hypothetical protein COA42_00595 [Alteromonadaceae bacterium]
MTNQQADNICTETSDAPPKWSHISETINMLYLAVCQIETTMHEANQSVDTLTSSFTKLANHTFSVSEQINDLHKVSQLASFKKDIAHTATELQANIGSSVEAFQFYDRVCQRIDHVARSLEKVSNLLNDEKNIEKQNAWKRVQEEIKGSYTMEAERIMFEYIMRGGSVAEALDIYNHQFSADKDKASDGDEIELF